MVVEPVAPAVPGRHWLARWGVLALVAAIFLVVGCGDGVGGVARLHRCRLRVAGHDGVGERSAGDPADADSVTALTEPQMSRRIAGGTARRRACLTPRRWRTAPASRPIRSQMLWNEYGQSVVSASSQSFTSLNSRRPSTSVAARYFSTQSTASMRTAIRRRSSGVWLRRGPSICDGITGSAANTKTGAPALCGFALMVILLGRQKAAVRESRNTTCVLLRASSGAFVTYGPEGTRGASAC